MAEEKQKICRVSQQVSKEAFDNLVAAAKENKVRKSSLIEAALLCLTPEVGKNLLDAARPKMIASGSKVSRTQIIAQLRAMDTAQLEALLAKKDQDAPQK